MGHTQQNLPVQVRPKYRMSLLSDHSDIQVKLHSKSRLKDDPRYLSASSISDDDCLDLKYLSRGKTSQIDQQTVEMEYTATAYLYIPSSSTAEETQDAVCGKGCKKPKKDCFGLGKALSWRMKASGGK